MKKIGFTLAEVLITLGIIGVIAALTLPTLTTSTTEAQIGPKLAKAAAMLEQANQAMLNRLGVDSFSDAGTMRCEEYFSELDEHLNFVQNARCVITLKDGMSIGYQQAVENLRGRMPHREFLGFITVDIDGLSNNGNNGLAMNPTMGTDGFRFAIYNDGSLRPEGGTNYLENNENAQFGGAWHWTIQCPRAEDGPVTNYSRCTGHIFENNLRVLYR